MTNKIEIAASVVIEHNDENPLFMARTGGNVLPPHLVDEDLKIFSIVSFQTRATTEVRDGMIVGINEDKNSVTVLDRHAKRHVLPYYCILNVTKHADYFEDGVDGVFPIETVPVEFSSPTKLLELMEDRMKPVVLIRHGGDWRCVSVMPDGFDFGVLDETVAVIQQSPYIYSGRATAHGYEGPCFASLLNSAAGEVIDWASPAELAAFIEEDADMRMIELSYEFTSEADLLIDGPDGEVRWPIEIDHAMALTRRQNYVKSDVHETDKTPRRIIGLRTNPIFDHAVEFRNVHIKNKLDLPATPRPLISVSDERKAQAKADKKASKAKKPAAGKNDKKKAAKPKKAKKGKDLE